jgi:hypothetical protein
MKLHMPQNAAQWGGKIQVSEIGHSRSVQQRFQRSKFPHALSFRH